MLYNDIKDTNRSNFHAGEWDASGKKDQRT